MITERQQDQASLYALGALPETERAEFEAALRANAELREVARGFQHAAEALARTAPAVELPHGLKTKVLQRIDAAEGTKALATGLGFLMADDSTGWKQLPIPGAWIKVLSLQKDRGYAVLLGKLDPGVRYPAHVNAGPEDFYILTGDLHIGDTRLNAGDFHHADAGSQHVENYSVGGCTLLAVLTTDDPLVAYAMA